MLFYTENVLPGYFTSLIYLVTVDCLLPQPQPPPPLQEEEC